jgi:archaemetzincin
VERVRVWWIGEGEPRKGAMEHVRLHLERAFGVPTEVREAPGRPAGTLDARRGQHSSTRMLEWLLARAPAAPEKLLGVTDMDLFIPILTFVFGEAQLGGAAAVVSTARLLDGASRDPRVLVERLAKEAVHEVGHAMGLVHCTVPECAMSRSASVREVDLKSGALCRDCLTRLREARKRAERT